MRHINLLNKARHFLDIVETELAKGDKILLKKLKVAPLDPIKKKKISYPSILYPIERAPLEWWYFTGHLFSGKRRFGFEYCIFKFHPQALRLGVIPMSLVEPKPYLVLHATITDKDKKSFTLYQDCGLISKQKINYEKVDLSISSSSLKLNSSSSLALFEIKHDSMKLKLKAVKKMVKHFDNGYAVMYEKPQQRTYYVTFPRMDVKGDLIISGKKMKVAGQAWFDHQKTSMPAITPLKGWDWFSIMLNDKTEIMFFTLRNKKGMVHNYLGGTYIGKNSKIVKLNHDDVVITSVSNWTSEKTGITYPCGWIMKIPKLKLDIEILPSIKNQEVDAIKTTPTSYWEGACEVKGKKNGKPITGLSYVELVGYDKRLISNIIKDIVY